MFEEELVFHTLSNIIETIGIEALQQITSIQFNELRQESKNDVLDKILHIAIKG